MSERPTGVTVLGVLYIIFSILQIIGGAMLLFFGGALVSMADMAGEPGMMGMFGFFSGFFMIMAIISVVLGLVGLAIGFGLLNGMEWARIIAIVLAAINIVIGVFSIMAGSGLLSIIFGIIVIWYLTRPHVTEYFKSSSEEL